MFVIEYLSASFLRFACLLLDRFLFYAHFSQIEKYLGRPPEDDDMGDENDRIENMTAEDEVRYEHLPRLAMPFERVEQEGNEGNISGVGQDLRSSILSFSSQPRITNHLKGSAECSVGFNAKISGNDNFLALKSRIMGVR